MTPPQSDMQTKPTAFVVEPSCERVHATGNSTRKYKIIGGVVIVSLLIIAGIVFGAIAYNYRLFYKEEYKAESRVDGDKIPENIYIDYKKELIYVNNKQQGKVDGMKALHNYDRKLVALYDETRNLCLIDTLDESFDDGLKYWSTYQGVKANSAKRTFKYSKDPIKPEVLRKFGGEEIATHCSNGNTTAHWITGTVPFVEGMKRDDETHNLETRSVHSQTTGATTYYYCEYYWVLYQGKLYLVEYCWYKTVG